MRALAAAAVPGVVALALAPAAWSHPQFWPTFVATGASSEVLLTAPNERKVPMTAIELTAPATVELLDARSAGAWQADLQDGVAGWRGGRLGTGKWGQFPLRLRATGDPGSAAFSVTQHFADGRTVKWPAELGVTPGAAADGGRSYGLAIAAAVAALVAAASVVSIRWLRRKPARDPA